MLSDLGQDFASASRINCLVQHAKSIDRHGRALSGHEEAVVLEILDGSSLESSLSTSKTGWFEFWLGRSPCFWADIIACAMTSDHGKSETDGRHEDNGGTGDDIVHCTSNNVSMRSTFAKQLTERTRRRLAHSKGETSEGRDGHNSRRVRPGRERSRSI